MKHERVEMFMVELVEQVHGTIYTNKRYAELINLEFGTNFTEKDVDLYFEPTIEEEVEDLKLMYENSIR